MLTQSQVEHKPLLDARTFQEKLNELATTLAFKVEREALQRGLKPGHLVVDLYYLIRQAQQTYNLFFFVNADKRRYEDSDWRPAYFVVMLPLVRSMIDCLYNITAILQNPGPNGYLFRASGYRLTLEAIDADERRYGGDPRWDEWIARQRTSAEFDMRINGFNEAEVMSDKKLWPTLSRYIRGDANTPPTPHQEFLKKLTLGFWQEYSAISHATFQGLVPIGRLLAPRDLPIEERPKVEEVTDAMFSIHIPRVAAILLSILTEVQAYFQFDGANIGRRLHEVWNELVLAPEVKELYDGRYAQLMKDRRINDYD